MMVEIYKTLCGGINKENLIDSACFYLKITLSHVFCLNFRQVCLFFDDDRSNLVLESTHFVVS